MKKIVTIFAVLGLGLLLTGCKTSDEETLTKFDGDIKQKVVLYEFYSDSCTHCKSLNNYLTKIQPRYEDCFEVEKFETSTGNNSEIMFKVATAFEENLEGYVPFYVVGDTPFTGYASSMNANITEAIETACTSDEYVDLVADIIK